VAARKPEVADAPDESAPAPDREPDAPDESAPPPDREPSAVDEPEPAGSAGQAASAPTAASGAPEGARVLALKMALDGTPRDETARYLRENFELDDPEALLDEVYARAGG
jgi:hypothetical protein